MKFKEDNIVFSSGTTTYAHAGIIGINSALELSYGYDGGFDDSIPKEDLRELANHMILLWKQYRDILDES